LSDEQREKAEEEVKEKEEEKEKEEVKEKKNESLFLLPSLSLSLLIILRFRRAITSQDPSCPFLHGALSVSLDGRR